MKIYDVSQWESKREKKTNTDAKRNPIISYYFQIDLKALILQVQSAIRN